MGLLTNVHITGGLILYHTAAQLQNWNGIPVVQWIQSCETAEEMLDLFRAVQYNDLWSR
jgi:hypothetical protein